MKTILIILVVLAGLFIIFQIYISLITNASTTQNYSLVKSKESFEVRYYPLVMMAVVSSPTKSYNDLNQIGFSKLADYVSGANKENKKIARTTPIHIDIGENVSSMGFIMPVKYTKESLPIPNDSNIIIKVTTGEHVAAIRFDGFASDKEIKEHIQILEHVLRKQGYAYYGNFRFLGYNPPYQLFNRRNEIIVTIANWD